MAITDLQIAAYVEDYLGGDPVGRTAIQIANHAGYEMMNARRWRWADGAASALGFTSGQNYIALPSDFHSIIGLPQLVNTIGTGFLLTSHSRLIELRTQVPDSASGVWHGVVAWDFTDPGAPEARLDLHPTPTATVTPAIRLYYRRDWAAFPATPNGTAAKIPPWMEATYIEFVRAIADGWEQDVGNPGMAQTYLAAVLGGPTFQSAAHRDAGPQGTLGTLGRGYLDSYGNTYDRTVEVQDPS